MQPITLQTLLDKGLKPATGWLYLHMATKAINDLLDATQADMAAWMGVSVTTVRGYLAQLENKNLIQCVGGGRYVVQSLVHPPTSPNLTPNPSPSMERGISPQGNPSVNAQKLTVGDADGLLKTSYATGSDAQILTVSDESESFKQDSVLKTKTLTPENAQNLHIPTLTPADGASPVPTLAAVMAEAVKLWGEMPRAWHELLTEMVRQYGAEWVIAALKRGQQLTGDKRPRHPKWAAAVIKEARLKGKSPESLGNPTPDPSPSHGDFLRSQAGRGTDTSRVPAKVEEPEEKKWLTLADYLRMYPMPQGWYPPGWRTPAEMARRTVADCERAWSVHMMYGWETA